MRGPGKNPFPPSFTFFHQLYWLVQQISAPPTPSNPQLEESYQTSDHLYLNYSRGEDSEK